jgi:hypothetical protein
VELHAKAPKLTPGVAQILKIPKTPKSVEGLPAILRQSTANLEIGALGPNVIRSVMVVKDIARGTSCSPGKMAEKFATET